MSSATVVCPFCGSGVETSYQGESSSLNPVGWRLKQEYRVGREACPECGNQYDLRVR